MGMIEGPNADHWFAVSRRIEPRFGPPRLRRARCEVCGGEFDVGSAAIAEHDGKIVHVICIPNIPAQ